MIIIVLLFVIIVLWGPGRIIPAPVAHLLHTCCTGTTVCVSFFTLKCSEKFDYAGGGSGSGGAADAVMRWATRLRDVFDQLLCDGAFADGRRARFMVQ